MNLATPLEQTGRLTDGQKKALKRLGIETVSDLLYYFPVRYGDNSQLSYIDQLVAGQEAIIYARVTKIAAKKTYQKKMTMTEAVLEDSSGKTIQAVWFSQPYISKMLSVGTTARFAGVVNERKGVLYLSNSEFEPSDIPLEKTGPLLAGEQEELMLYPVYKQTKGITSKWIYHKIKKILTREFLDTLVDPIPSKILESYKLPGLSNSLLYIHSPKKRSDAEAARKRFAFEEVFLTQLVKQNEKKQYEQSGAFVINPEKSVLEKFVSNLPFALTDGQQSAVADILDDLKSDKPMSRLLEGDVGSGKTIIAAMAAYATVKTHPKNQNFGHLQVAYMAPTEILAKQIYADFVELMQPFNISVGLITGKDCFKFPSKTSDEPTKISKNQLKKWTENGEVQILVGTHALIAKTVFFENLGLVIIDEQHRFGKNQRAALRQKPQAKQEKNSALRQTQDQSKIEKKGAADNTDILPHLLSMSATPIPRTLALTIYGDLDLTVLDELPPGRKKIITEIVRPDKRNECYEEIQKNLEEGRQLYVICPRIFEPDETKAKTLQMKSAVGEAERLGRDVFPEYSIGVLHSKLKKDEKVQVMADFHAKKYDILVATSVVEVGVNVPNATMIILEGAERFGLSQLHQLRGRVMRSSYQPYCYVFADAKTENTQRRMQAFIEAKNGFELAEYDMQFRGAGEMMGNKQWGVSDLAMEAIKNIKLVEAARKEAGAIISSRTLDNYPALETKFEEIQKKMYLE